MSSSSGSVNGYAAYTGSKSKRSSASSLSGPFIRPASPSASGSTSAGASMRAPQASRPSLPAQWSAAPGSPTPSSSSPPPPPASPPPANSFPFHSVPPGNSPFPPSTPTRSHSPQTPRANTSPAPQQQQQQQRTRTPYRAAFQPAGVRRDRTEEFAQARRKKSEATKLEEGRLCRRMDKLVALHFPAPVVEERPLQLKPSNPLAQMAEIGGSLRGKTAKDLWRSVAGGKSDAELAEQTIVKWQDDASVARCPICSVSFGLKTRRHHCRLCGRVVCFLPPAPPTRPERCSTFFTYEYDDRIGTEKKPQGVIVELEQVEQDLSLGAVVKEGAAPVREKDEREKVRICRDCLDVVLRHQEATLPQRTPTWVKLYEVLVQLESSISTALPEFEELVLGLKNPSSSTTTTHAPSAQAALSLRQRLLTNLASYDTLSKRVLTLPAPPGSSQDRLQRAIAARAGLFLVEKLGLLRSLGEIEQPGKEGKGSKKGKGRKVGSGEVTVRSLKSLMDGKGVEEEREGDSGQLAVLLEQEALVQGYVEDANARRQFEDAASLKASLSDLREEIARVRAAG